MAKNKEAVAEKITNKISIADKISDVVAKDFTQTTELTWHDLTFKVKHNLSFKEMMSFVNDVVMSCFALDTNEYLPEIKDLTIRCCILEYYAGIELPRDIADKYDLVYSSDLVDKVVTCINSVQLRPVLMAIDAKIDSIVQSNIEALNIKMEEVVSGLEELESNLAGIFNGVDSDTISKLADAIVSGNLDENKLAKSFYDKTHDSGNVVRVSIGGE